MHYSVLYIISILLLPALFVIMLINVIRLSRLVDKYGFNLSLLCQILT
jgi:hypothetical protein